MQWATRILRKNAFRDSLRHWLVYINLQVLVRSSLSDVFLRIESKRHEAGAERVTDFVFIAMRLLGVELYLLEVFSAIVNTIAYADG